MKLAIYKRSFIIVIALLIFGFLPHQGLSADKKGFYSEVVKKYFSDIRILGNLEKNTGIGYNETLLLLASEVAGMPLNYYTSFNTAIVVCDSAFYFNDFACDYNSVFSPTYSAKEDLHIGVFSLATTRFILIPEMYFISPPLLLKLERYLYVLNSGDPDTRGIAPPIYSFLVNTYKTSVSIRMLVIFLVTLVFFVSYIVFTGEYSKRLVVGFQRRSVSMLCDYRSVSFYLFTILFFIFIFILSLISLLDIRTVSIDYFISYIGSLLDVNMYYGAKSLTDIMPELFLLSYLFVLCLLLIMAIGKSQVGVLYSMLKGVFTRTNTVKVSNTYLMIIYLVIMFLLISTPDRFSPPLITFVILLFSYMLWFRFSLPLEDHKSNISRAQSIVVFFVAIMLFHMIHQPLSDFLVKPKFVDLITRRSAVVFLPYKISRDGNALYRKYEYDLGYPIFVDKFLIYYPGVSEIYNLPLIGPPDSGRGSFFITNTNKKDTVRKLLSDNSLAAHFYVAETGQSRWSTLLLSGYTSGSGEFGSEYLHVRVSCENGIGSIQNLRLYLYSLVGGDLKVESADILNFPGCAGKYGSFSNYRVPVRLNAAGEIILASVEGMPPDVFLQVRLESAGGGAIPIQPLSADLSQSILEEKVGGRSKVMYNYSPSLEREFYLRTSIRENGHYDLSVPINRLVTEGLVGDPFVVWSNVDGAVIKENY